MNMKKLVLLPIALLAIVACQKDPDMSELSDEYMVATVYDNTYNFNSPTTVYVPATTIDLLDNPDGQIDEWNDANSRKILDTVAYQLTQAGYTVVRGDVPHDMEMNVSFVENTTYFVDYPYWWWDPYYYWWDGWYYPYPVVYGYTTGALILEFVVPNLQQNTTDIPSKWYAYITGAESGSENTDTQYMIRGVGTAFTQSPYFKKTGPQ